MDTSKPNDRILITGGTAGLGRSMALKFLKEDFDVVVLGRKDFPSHTETHNYTFIYCDFSDLDHVNNVGEELSKMEGGFKYLINNAGILSPPFYQQTKNGYELTYQINFLAHVLLTKLLLSNNTVHPECVVNISSVMHKKGKIESEELVNKNNYSIVQAYGQSKLFLSLFCEKLMEGGIQAFCFNPGTFSSSIYRMQNKWFHHLYKFAAPFMVTSDKVAQALAQILLNKQWEGGKMINISGSIKNLKEFDSAQKQIVWDRVDAELEDYYPRIYEQVK